MLKNIKIDVSHTDSTDWFFRKFILFFYYLFLDIKNFKLHKDVFREFGMTMFCGRQGAGKTTAMMEYLYRMKKKYPKCIIVTNFNFVLQDRAMESWEDFLNVRNGDFGVVFAVDEIQNEFNSAAWKNFPENLLSEITQQRKQRIKIVSTSQVYTRVAKPLREQTYTVVECYTFLGRWTFEKAFHADEYNVVIDNPERKNKLHRRWRKNFVQTDYLRSLFDSYAKIQKMKNVEMLPRSERLS